MFKYCDCTNFFAHPSFSIFQFIDFSPKGGPDKLLAKYEDGGIVFPDGNKWTKVARGTPNRRPKDMSTLKSE